MAKFTDKHGREWVVEFDPLILKKIRDDYGLNLADISNGTDSAWWTLLNDAATVCFVAQTACEDQIRERGITGEDFIRSLNGDSIDDALKAIEGGMADFFPQRSRSMLACLLKTMRAMIDAGTQKAMKRLSDPRLLTAFDARIDKLLDEHMAKFESETSGSL